jgi:hypothetical protein
MMRRVVASILSSFDLHDDDRTAGNNDVTGVFCRLPRQIRKRSTKSRVIGRLKLLKRISQPDGRFYVALLILTTGGRSLRGVVTTKPGGHVVRARSSSTVFSETPVSESALTFMSFGKPATAR